MKVQINRLEGTDVLINGGTLYGCYLAWYLAQEGYRVTVVTSGVSLGTEITDHYASWISDSQVAELPEPMKSLITKSIGHRWHGENILNINQLACYLEDLLIDCDIRYYYQARPAALLKKQSHLGGLAVGGKFGVAAIPAFIVIDTSSDGILARLDGCTMDEVGAGKRIVKYVTISNEAVPEKLNGMVSEIAEFSCSLAAHEYYIEYSLESKDNLANVSNSEMMLKIQMALLEINAAVLAKHGHSLDIFLPSDAYAISAGTRISGSRKGKLSHYLSEISQNLIVLGPTSADASIDDLAFQLDVSYALSHISSMQSDILEFCTTTIEGLRDKSFENISLGNEKSRVLRKGQYSFTDYRFSEPGVENVEVEFSGAEQWFDSDAIVIGGGTSGFPCALELAKLGVEATCLEMHAFLGGTNTVGGVSRYWYGFWNPYLGNYLTEIKDTTETLGIPVVLAKIKIAFEHGLKFLPNMAVCGVIRQENKVGGICVLTENGISVLNAKYFIDATGDGDIAAWAGNDYWYGMDRDESTLFYSYGKFSHGNPEVHRHFNSVLDVRSLRDYTRCITIGRRQYTDNSDNEYPQFYVATRESRHITGIKKVTYVDMLMNRAFDDTIAVCRSDVDIKGFSASDAAMVGFIEPDYYRAWDCCIPYGAIVPKDLSNMLVAGRAYSITHDAVGMARMQPDMISVGAASAHALQLAISENTDFHHLNVPELQKTLIERGLLIKAYVENTYERTIPTDGEMRILAERFYMGVLEMNTKARILTNKEACVKYISEAIKKDSTHSKEMMAVMLCYQRNREGVDILLRALEDILNLDELPRITNIEIIRSMPDMGHAPPAAFWISAVGLTKDRRLIPLIERFIDKLNLDPSQFDYRNTYVIAIAHALERIACKEAVPALERLLESPALKDRNAKIGDDIRGTSDFIAERYSYTNLWLSRALARCGSVDGYLNLIDFLDSVAVFLCRNAFKELRELTGQDFGFDKAAWKAWLDGNKESIVEIPFDEVIL